jgi:hypothetical protein
LNKLYFDYTQYTDLFIFGVDANSQDVITVNMDKSNFIGYSVPSGYSKVIPFVSNTITQNQYENNLAQNWDMDSMYVVSHHSYDDDSYTDIFKIIPDSENNATFEIDLQMNNGSVEEYEAIKNYDVIGVDNILTISEDNISNVENIKYIEEISASELNTYYENYLYSSFPEDAKGYRLYQKQNQTICRIHGDDNNSNISSLDDFISENTLFNGTRFLDVNHMNMNKILLFSEIENQLIEFDTSDGTQTVAGTWSLRENVVCNDPELDARSMTSFDMIEFDLAVDGYSNDNIAIYNNSVYRVEYNEADTYKEYILLEEVAAKHIYFNELYYYDYLALDIELSDMWTYLSLPSNITICSEEYTQYLYDSICSSGITLNSIFSPIGKVEESTQSELGMGDISSPAEENISNANSVEMVLKFSNNTWSYWEPSESNVTYNMNKFNTLNHKEGFLVKITEPTTIRFPLNIFKVEKPSKVNRYNQEGWYLAGSQFNQKVEDISIDNGELMYVVAPDSSNTNWNVFTPKTELTLDPSIEIIEELKIMQGYWIYNK